MAKQTPEGKVKDAITDILDRVGAAWHKPMGSEFGSNGVSDIIAAVPTQLGIAVHMAIEAKATKRGKPTELQKGFLNQTAEAGGVALVVHKDNLEYFERLVLYVVNASHRELQALGVRARNRRFALRKPSRTKNLPVPREEFIRASRDA